MFLRVSQVHTRSSLCKDLSLSLRLLLGLLSRRRPYVESPLLVSVFRVILHALLMCLLVLGTGKTTLTLASRLVVTQFENLLTVWGEGK